MTPFQFSDRVRSGKPRARRRAGSHDGCSGGLFKTILSQESKHVHR